MGDVVSGLWVGDSLGPLERLSIRSFLGHGHPYDLYAYGAIDGVPDGVALRDANEVLPESSIFRYRRGPGKGSVAAFANLFRYKFLWERGGWWVDLDVVCLRPFDFPEPVVLASEHAGKGWQAANCVIKVPRGLPLCRDCLDEAARRDPLSLNWGETGPTLWNRAILGHNLTRFVKNCDVFCPVPWWRWDLAVSEVPDACRPFLTANTRAVHLWHEMYRRSGIHRSEGFPAGSLVSQLRERYGAERV